MKVSIIIPCYNQGIYLDETIKSVLSQTYVDWECIIIDDGSPDNTEEVALSLCQIDSRIKFFKKENGGLSSARNAGIDIATSEYILPLDADDKLGPDYLLKAVPILENNSDVKVVYCRAEFFGEMTGEWINQEFSLTSLAKRNMIFCTALFRKADWKKVGGYDENMKYGWEDWEFWINILKNGGEVVKIDYVGFYYRIRESSMLRSIKEEHIIYMEKYMCEKHYLFFYDYLGNPMYLYRRMQQYVETLNYISNKRSVKLYKKFKALIGRGQ